MATICLNMIVKDEAAIIADTLKNILDYMRIDYWVIADTGSSDDTMGIIQRFFAERGIAGELVQHPWKNFGHNRQLALEAARGKGDYVFFFDADDRFEGTFALPEPLIADAYSFYLSNMAKTTRYPRRLLVKNNDSLHWVGVLHEVITPKDPSQSVEHFIEGDYHVVSGRFGARNQDPDKYLKDAQILAQAFEEETDMVLKRRYSYYCGQSYRDAQQPALAAQWFERNLSLFPSLIGEEARFSFIALGAEYRKLGDSARTIQAWLNAYNAVPQNAEALGLLAEYYFQLERYQLGYEAAKKAIELPAPNPRQTLFINEPVHRYVLWYELGRNAIKLSLWDEVYRSAKYLIHQPEHSDALNAFILNILEALKSHIERDSFQDALAIHRRLKHMTRLNDESQQKRQQLLQWFEQHFHQP